MSRIANQPVAIPSGVDVSIQADILTVKGSKGTLTQALHDCVGVEQTDNQVQFTARDTSKFSHAMSGTMRALVSNMVKGVSEGFEKRLRLVGVGYRAQSSGNKLELSLGFSHPVVYTAPDGISLEVIKQTEIVVQGYDKQVVGQVAADIRAYRPPEPYKGKGVRYADERVSLKETKKK